MTSLFPYGLRRIWVHPALQESGGLRAQIRCLGRSGAWISYQLQKHLGLFPTEGRVIPWIDGLRLRLLTTSQHSQACLYYGGPIDWPSMQFLRHYLRPDDLCADIGANVGLYTLLIAHYAGAASVHSFECLPLNIPKLRDNLSLNQLDEVTVHPVALSDRDGVVQLNQGDGDVTTSISPSLVESNVKPPCEGFAQSRRLDGFSWTTRFAYIKIDVEGAEQLVLSGSEQLLCHCPPMVWSFEYLDTQERLGSSKAALLDGFARWNYRFFLYNPSSSRLMSFAPDANGVYPSRQDDNVLAIHSSAIDLVARRLCGLE